MLTEFRFVFLIGINFSEVQNVYSANKFRYTSTARSARKGYRTLWRKKSWKNNFTQAYITNYLNGNEEYLFVTGDDIHVQEYLSSQSIEKLREFVGKNKILIIDEAQYSSTVRSAAWIKATYNSLWDTLLTYHSEETQVTMNTY